MTCPTDDDLIRRGDAIAACAVGPSDEWARATKSGYMQAATDCTFNVLRIPAAVSRAPLAASLPADPVTNAGYCQPVRVKPVQIKPLVWEHGRNRLQMDSTMMMGKGYDFDTMELTRQEGYGFGCGYIIWAIRSGLGKKSWNVYGTLDGIFIQDIASEDAAKDAAQADYEASILAALELAPVTLAEALKVQTLVAAGERMTGPLWRLILADENCIKNPCDLPTCECRQKFDRIAGPWFAALAAWKDATK